MSVWALRDLLAAHARGELDEDALLAAARQPIRAAGSAAARAALIDARDDGQLAADIVERLLSQLEDDADGDRTRLIPGGTRSPATPGAQHEDGGDSTRLIAGGTRSPSTPGAQTDPGTDSDLTRVLPGGTAAAARERSTRGSTSGSRPAAPTGADVHDPTPVATPTETSRTSDTATPVNEDATAIVAPPGGSPTAAIVDSSAFPSAQDNRELGVGDEIKGRFRLTEPIGQGGMGTIWKAVDKRREEARDRNPYIAIKLLAGDFKNHPEAFIALQRECAKQQRLAHPNIATVYDFDRDGDTVYMTMVLLEGQPLDVYIRSLPKGGLSPAQAMPVVEQLAAGLSYAHENGLVHSDLKPGNCYLLEDGNVRLLDFGIARASRTREDAAGETTVFDPGQLGALTPTYATVEMFDGQDPDPRDDIYALGIIAYQLLTGEHPFGKKSAPKAMQLGLEPAAVPSLDKRQNRGLRRSLAFLRDERTPSVAEFLADLRPRKSRAMPIAVGALALLLVVAALSWKPVQDYLRERDNEEVIAVFMRGDEASIKDGLALVEALPDESQRQQIAEDPRTRDAIIGLYVKRTSEHFDPAAGRYDFAAGEAQMALLAGLYPDSAEVLKTRNEYQASRKRLLTQLDTRLRELLQQRRLLPDADGEDVADVLDIVHSVSPGHPLLADPGVAATFVTAATQASESGDWPAALTLLETGELLSPGDASVANRLTEVRAELARQRDAARVVALRERWQGELATLGEAAALAAASAELTELQTLAPEETLFEPLEAIVDPLLDGRIDTLLAQSDAAGARALLVRDGRFASVAKLVELRARLGDTVPPTPEANAAAVQVDEWLAREPDAAGHWQLALASALKILLAQTGADDPQATRRQAAVATRLDTLAQSALAQERFEDSARWLTRAERLAPQLAPAWASTREALAAARVATRERAAAAARAAQLEQMRADVQSLVTAGDARGAREALAAYATEAGAGDEYARDTGPRLVAEAYLALATAAAGPEESLLVVREGLGTAPDHGGLQERAEALAASVLERALSLTVQADTARAAPAPTTIPVRAAPPAPADERASPVETVRGLPASYPALHSTLLARVAATFVTAATQASESGDWPAALTLLETGELLSPGDASVANRLTEVRAELARQRDAARVVALRERWQGELATLGEAAALAAASAELTELQTLAPEETLFEPLEAIVDPLLDGRIDTLLAQSDAAGARALLVRDGRFASVAKLVELRARLGDTVPPTPEANAAAVQVDEWLAREPDAAGHWQLALASALKILLAQTGADDPQATRRQAAVATRLDTLAQSALAQERFEDSARWLTRAERLAPQQAPAWASTREALAAARVATRERAAAAARAAQLEQMRADVQSLVTAGDARGAREALAAYATEAGAGDEYARDTGPRLVAEAYLALATAAAGPEESLLVVREGLGTAPDHGGLQERAEALAASVLERALSLTVQADTARAAPAPTTIPVRAAPPAPADERASPVETVRGLPASYPALGDDGARGAREVLARRGAESTDLNTLQVVMNDYDMLFPEAAAAMRAQVGDAVLRAVAERTRVSGDGLGKLRRVTSDFRALFPEQWPEFSSTVGRRVGRDIERLQGEDLQRAHNLLASARKVLPGSAPLDTLRLKELPKPSRYAPIGLEQVEAGQLTAAQKTLAKMLAEEPGHEQVPMLRGTLEQRQQDAQAHYDAFQQYLRARRKREGEPYLQHALTLWTDNAQWRAEYTQQYETAAERQGACSARLAGYGRRSRGTCYDETKDGNRGPVLVVVPAGGPAKTPFAIGKFEVSVAEFNDYCERSGSCSPLPAADTSLPVTGVRISDAEAYAKWLSTQSGAVYRLPTAGEWTYAAQAGGKQPRKDFNCRVTSGGSIIKGHGLVDVQSGQQNGWGIANYVGNAQEWARDGSKLSAHGGAFEDPLARCGPDLRRDHDGSADGMTGFRLLREIS